MCGFFVTNCPVEQLSWVNERCQFRGPDVTTSLELDSYTFVHNLLSITGVYAEQPFLSEEEGIICVYNGEIYNADGYRTDGLSLIPRYLEKGPDFVSELDGEFAITLLDLKNKRLLVSTDTFRTKPLYIGKEGEKIAIASYPSCIKRLGFSKAFLVEPNSTLIFQSESLEVMKTFPVHTFDLHQHKTGYESWEEAFCDAIRKRAGGCREKVFIALSGGYDSGALACELQKQRIPFKAFSVFAGEDKEVLENRLSTVEHAIVQVDPEVEKSLLLARCEPFESPDGAHSTTQRSRAALGLSAIARRARSEGYKIFLSGHGSDEILSDYGFASIPYYEEAPAFEEGHVRGAFPKDLSSVFPWKNFYKGKMLNFLSKEERVLGSWGVEARYPYLDLAVVQEFLWLTAEAKNLHWKAPLYAYLVKNQVPTAFGMENKRPFKPFYP